MGSVSGVCLHRVKVTRWISAGASMVTVTALTALARVAPPQRRAVVMSFYMLANNAAVGIFPVVGGFIGDRWGWRSTATRAHA